MHKSKRKQAYVSIIIPTYYDWERLQLCLTALENQTYSKGCFEIIVVNNAPEDKPPVTLVIPDNCCLVDEAKPGSYAARNKGISIAVGEILAFTDSDCLPDECWLTNAVNFFNSNPSIDRIGGNIELFYRSHQLTVAEIYEKGYAFRQSEFVSKQGMAATGNMLTKKGVVSEIGPFDDSLMSGGDALWGKKASAAGYTIEYVRNVNVKHPARFDLKAILLKNRRETAGQLKTNKKAISHNLITIFLKLLPPLKSVGALKNRELSIKEKSVAFFVRYLLRVNSAVEMFRLILLNKKEERK